MEDSGTPRLVRPRAVTFDCWSTLIRETGPGVNLPGRARKLSAFLGVSDERARAALRLAGKRHHEAWHRHISFPARAMTNCALEVLDTPLPGSQFEALLELLEEEGLEREVIALPGAREALATLASAGVRLALICDTGWSPGRVVRKLLERVGVLEFLEVCVFSDEVGAPKPARLPFATALEALGESSQRAVHVGDIRRSDVAGARAFGMGSIRIALHHDDCAEELGASSNVIGCRTAGCDPVCPRPEADHVARTYPEVLAALGYG